MSVSVTDNVKDTSRINVTMTDDEPRTVNEMILLSPGLISKRPLNLKFAAPPAIIGFMIFSYCLDHKMIISKHYSFQKLSDRCFFEF